MTDYTEIRRALEKARDRFREYERSHQSKADRLWNAPPGSADDTQRDDRADKAKRNREMADMLDVVIADPLPSLLADAERWREIVGNVDELTKIYAEWAAEEAESIDVLDAVDRFLTALRAIGGSNEKL
jgi:hypothetical protein